MPLRIYRGSLDSDMIERCFDEISGDRLSRHLVIIPEHYSYEMERMAVDRFGVIGVNNIEVVTPHRLAVNLLLKDSAAYLNPAGKQMLITLAISLRAGDGSVSDEARRIMGSRAFASNMVTLISEFKRHMITPEMLADCARLQRQRRSGAHLADKLTAAAAVYEEYDRLLGEKHYVDMDDDISRLADKIEEDIPIGERLREADVQLLPKKKELRECLEGLAAEESAELRKRAAELRMEIDAIRGPVRGLKAAVCGSTRVWFMCFDEYLPHHMRLVEAAIRAAKEVTVCLHYVKPSDSDGYEAGDMEKLFSEADIDSLEKGTEEVYKKYNLYYDAAGSRVRTNIKRDAHIYSVMERSYGKLTELGKYSEKFFSRCGSVKRAADVDFLVKNYNAPEKYGARTENIEIARCADPHREIEFAAETIHTLVRESEQRYESAAKRHASGAYAADAAAARKETDALLRSALKDRGAAEERLPELRELIGIGEPREPRETDMLRYRDFGILFGGASDYSHILDAIFTEHGIRYFADDKIVLSEHPIAVQLLSVFDICETDWSYEAMLRYLNAGFIFRKKGQSIVRLDAGDAAYMDNYVLRYDIRGRRLWNTEWSYSGEVFAMTWRDGGADRGECPENDRVNALRKSICAPLIRLIPEDGEEEKSAAEHVEALYAFLADIYMYEGLQADVRRFGDSGAAQTAQQFGQIWNKLVEVINQISVTMGDMRISFAGFGEYLRAGLSKCEITTIPSSLDAVYTGTVERSTSKPVRKLFVMGAVSGTYPCAETLDGFFTDIDRGNIRSYGDGRFDLAPTKPEQRIRQRYKVYKAIRTASDSVSVTYPVKDNEGALTRPSAFITDISAMFDISEHSAFPSDPSDERNITSRYAARRGLVINSAAPMSRLDPVWRSVYRCFRDDGMSDIALDQIALAASYYTRPPRLMSETAQRLYTRMIKEGETGRVYSATNLDSYAQCPMQYFMQYGLRLAEDAQGGVQPNEIGTYVHRLVQTVCDDVYAYDETLGAEENAQKCAEAWSSLDEQALTGKIEDRVKETSGRLSETVADRHMRGALMDRIRKTVSRSAVNILRSLKQGKFVLKATELEIDKVRIEDEIYIKGYVDRVDEFVYDSGGKRESFLRIIDYKTGSTKFSESSIMSGRDMQLMVYAIAAAMQFGERGDGESYTLSGVYYQHIRDKYSPADSFGADEARKELYLDGPTYLPDDKTEHEKRQALINAINEKDAPYIGLRACIGGKSGKNAKSEADRDKLIARVKENIRGIDREIMAGRIAPRPYRDSQRNACSYCRFKEICSYEGAKSGRSAGDVPGEGGE